MQGAALVAVRHIMSPIFSFLFGRPLTLLSRTLQADIRRKSRNFILNALLRNSNKCILTPSVGTVHCTCLASLKAQVETFHAVGERTHADEVDALLGIVADGVVGDAT